MEELKTEFLGDLVAHFNWGEVLDVGNTTHGIRRIVYVKDGTFEGPKVKAVMLPGGGDWFIRRPDGVVELDVRIVLRADDNHLIYAYYRGINDAQPEVGIKIMSGEAVDPSQYYFRVTPVFETASEKYGWLNRIVAVGMGRIIPTGVAYRVYQVL
jgi:hypothetical protein